MGVVPFDKENKLSSKRVLTRQKLIEIQENLPKHLQEKGFKIERGERNSQAKHKSVTKLKIETAKRVQELEQETAIMQNGVSHYSQELHEISEQVEEKQELVKTLENKAEKLQFEVSDWQKNIKDLGKEKNALEEKNKALKETAETYEFNISASKQEFESMLNDIDGFKEFQDLVGQLEPRQWKAMLTSDILNRYKLEPVDIKQADRWKFNLDNGKEFITKTYADAIEALIKAKNKLNSKVHQSFDKINPFGNSHKERQKTRQKSLLEIIKEKERIISQRKEKSLRSKNKDGLER